MSSMNQPTLGHTLLIVENMDTALPFWIEGVGFTIKSQEAGYVELLDKQSRIFGLVTPECMEHFLGVRPQIAKPALGVWQNSCFLSIETFDLNETLTLLKHHDVIVLKEACLMPWGTTVAFLQDPSSGFCFELCQK